MLTHLMPKTSATRGKTPRPTSRPPREHAVIAAELRGLGGLVLEQALVDRGAQPISSLVDWTNRLAEELGVDGVGAPENYGQLLRGIVKVNRRAEETASAVKA